MSDVLSKGAINAQDRNRSACISCHRRKVKCDRLLDRCSACLQIDLPCRYPSSTPTSGAATNHGPARRKSRGPYKKGKSAREKELEDLVRSMTRRCEELESLLREAGRANLSRSAPAAHASEASTVPTTLRGYTVGDSPASAGSTVTFGGETKFQPTPTSRSVELSSSPLTFDASQPVRRGRLSNVIYADPYQRIGSTETLPHHPPQDQIFELWQIYIIRVDPVTKLVHCPSFAEQLLLVARRPQAVEASMHTLMFSIYFASVNSISEDEVTDRFHESKEVLSARYMQGMQTALAYPDALQRPGIFILQALVLHAVCLHKHDDGDQESFAKTLRFAHHVARLMGVDKDDHADCSPHEVEIRRRCWWTLCMMGQHCVQGPGSPVHDDILESDVPLPLNINDIDLSPTTADMPKVRTAITEMSYFLVTLDLIRLTSKLQHSGNFSTSLDIDPSNRIQCEKMVEEFVKRLERNVLWHCDPSRPFDWFLMLTGKAMLNPIEIMMLDQVETAMHQSEATPGHPHEAKDDAKFSLRLDVVECWHILKTNKKLKPWSWFSRIFRQAFTVDDLYAELARRPQSAHIDRAHALIDLISLG